jgi:hypothetical protein
MAEQTAERKKTEASSDNPILKYLGPSIFTAVVAVLTWFTAGSTILKPALTALAVLAGIRHPNQNACRSLHLRSRETAMMHH